MRREQHRLHEEVCRHREEDAIYQLRKKASEGASPAHRVELGPPELCCGKVLLLESPILADQQDMVLSHSLKRHRHEAVRESRGVALSPDSSLMWHL
jgi:hypothetical protein